MEAEEFSVKCDKNGAFPTAHLREMITSNVRENIIRALFK